MNWGHGMCSRVVDKLLCKHVVEDSRLLHCSSRSKTGTRVPVDHMPVSHTGMGIVRTVRQMDEMMVTRETGAGDRYIVHMFFNDRNMVPARARLMNNTSHLMMRAKMTLLPTFGTCHA